MCGSLLCGWTLTIWRRRDEFHLFGQLVITIGYRILGRGKRNLTAELPIELSERHDPRVTARDTHRHLLAENVVGNNLLLS